MQDRSALFLTWLQIKHDYAILSHETSTQGETIITLITFQFNH